MAPRFIALLAAASSVLAATNFGVKTATFYVQEGAYVCPGTATQVFYPDAGGKFPVVIYAHGQGGGLEGCDNALRTAASHGLVVIAPMTGGFDGGTCSSANAHKDIFRAIKFAKRQGRKQLPVLRSQANWRKLAVWGYSMGGKAATRAASRAGKQGVRFQALVAAHGARQSRKVPKHTDTLYVTSSEDTSSSPPAKMYKEYKANGAHKKIYANLQGQPHTEACAAADPPGAGLMNQWVAKFLRCSLSGSHCGEVYGGDLCAANTYKSCHVHHKSTLAAQGPIFV